MSGNGTGRGPELRFFHGTETDRQDAVISAIEGRNDRP